MGYTHYWDRPTDNAGTAEMFGKLALDTKKIIKQAELNGIRIRDAYGLGEANFNEAYFGINGDAEAFYNDLSNGRGRDLAHEGFVWEGIPNQPEHRKGEPTYFNFCKTAYKPYDAVITAVLIRAKVIYGQCVDISSDGDWSEWQAGRDLYASVFGELAECPFSRVTS